MPAFSIIFDCGKTTFNKKKNNSFQLRCIKVNDISAYQVGTFPCKSSVVPFAKTYKSLSSEKEEKLKGRVTSWDSYNNKSGYIQFNFNKNSFRAFFINRKMTWTLGEKEINICASIYKLYKNGKKININDLPLCGNSCFIGIDSASCDAMCDLYCISPTGGYPSGCDCSCSAARFCCCSF